MNELHAHPARMHKKRQLGLPIVGGGGPGAGAANPTSAQNTVPAAPSSAPAAAAPTTRALPDPVTTRTFSLPHVGPPRNRPATLLLLRPRSSFDRDVIFISQRSVSSRRRRNKKGGESGEETRSCDVSVGLATGELVDRARRGRYFARR